MSCNCGCPDNKTPATGWRRFVPAVVGAVIVAALIAGALLKDNKQATMPGEPHTERTSSATRP